MDDRSDLLDAALRIGRRIASRARWEQSACTWTVMSPDRSDPARRVAVEATAGGALYEGTAGIGLFLAELAAASGDAEVARAALGGVEHALREGDALAAESFGFHAGRVGIAYAAMRVGELLDRPDLFPRAEALLRPLAGNEAHDRGLDVIGGAGGAIPALLRLAERVDPALATGIAVALGERLIRAATRGPDGFSWATMASSSIRDLCGYAHGAAGMGHGLLELYAATGDGRYRYAAEQAFLYERAFFAEEVGNWPDLRHTELGEYQYEGRLEELRERLRAEGSLPAVPRRFMSAWCHGAPGIGLARLRAWELLGDPRYLEEARAAFATTAGTLEEKQMNFSLCHGAFGNAETLLEGARLLGEPSLLAPVLERAREGVRLHESGAEGARPWPCGTLGGVSDPGLLLGEAGIGLFLLRLARPETQSALCVTAPDDAAAAGGTAGAAGYAALRDETVEAHFGPTLAAFRGLGVDIDAAVPRRPMGGAPERSDLRAAFEALAGVVASEADPARAALLEDAFAVDRATFELAASVEDYTREYTDSLVRRPAAEVEWSAGRVVLGERVRVLSTRHDWPGWLLREDAPAPPPEEDAFYLAQFSGGRATVRSLSPFAALVLQSVEAPATVDDVLAAVEEALGGSVPERGWLEDRVTDQLAQAYRAGFVGFEPGGVPAPA